MKLVYQYVVIFFEFLNQFKNCGSNSRLVVDEDDNGKFRLERVNESTAIINIEFFQYGTALKKIIHHIKHHDD